MKNIFKIFLTAYFLLLTAYCFAQTSGFPVYIDKASTTYLQWKVAGDFTGYDSLHFVVKPCTTSSTCGQLIKKNCAVTYSKPYSTVKCTLYVGDTDDFNAAKYYWSIYAYGSDTIAVRSGTFNLQLNGQTPIDGVASTSPIYTIAIDSSDQEPGVLIGRNSNNLTDWWSLGMLGDSIGVVTGQAADIDSLYGLIGDLDSLYTGETYERYVGYSDYSDGKFPLTLTGLQNAIADLPNDSGVVNISYPGVDTLGLGALPWDVELKGWVQYCSDLQAGIYEANVIELVENNATAGILEITLDGDAIYNIPIFNGETHTTINPRIIDSINARSSNWFAYLDTEPIDVHINAINYGNKINTTADTSGLNFDYFILLITIEGQVQLCNSGYTSIEIIDSLENYDRVTTNSNKSSITTINTNLNTWHSFASNIYKIGKPGRQLYFNNGAYSDFWIGGFVTPPYNLPYLVNIGNEYRTDYLNDTLKLFLNFQHLFYIDGTGTPRWGSTSAGFVNGNFGLAVGDLPDSVGLDWNWNDMVGVHVQMFDEVNKTAVAKRFPMPMYGFRFRFGGDINYYTFPYVYGYYSDFTSFGDQARVEQGWHFYGKGDFPSYFGGHIQLGASVIVPATISSQVTLYNSSGSLKVKDGTGNIYNLTSNYFSGTATLTIGNEAVVTHGVGSTPLIQDISITPQTTTFGFPYWVSNVTSTTFTINLGTVGLETRIADILFSWQIRRQ